MSILTFNVTDFRNLKAVTLTPQPQGLNVICGLNGSGKTSLLESIYYLSAGRSFRTSTHHRLIREGQVKFSLHTQLQTPHISHVSAGAERDIEGNTRLKLGEKTGSRLSDIAALLPILLINADSHEFFEGGPAFRRKYLDWGLFYDSPAFIAAWRQYERVLRQRNAALKERCAKSVLEGWTVELAKHGEVLDAYRRDYITRLTPVLFALIERLYPLPELSLAYSPGWEGDEGFLAALQRVYFDELQAGHTLLGPHRADLDLRSRGDSVRHILSRGQQKCLICAIILAQGRLLTDQHHKGSIYLIDDLPSELDEVNQAKLISLLFEQGSQVFITAIEKQVIAAWMKLENAPPVKVFHVEHGQVDEISP